MYGVILTDDVTQLNFDQSPLNVKRTKIFRIFHKLVPFSNIVLRKLLNWSEFFISAQKTGLK